MVGTGQAEEGMELVNRAVAISPDETGLLYNVACIYSTVGRTDEALDHLERAVRAGYNHRAWMEADSDFDPIRQHPRFQALLKQIDDRK
jgi:tetratricopeptide (TPR) repeat protein